MRLRMLWYCCLAKRSFFVCLMLKPKGLTISRQKEQWLDYMTVYAKHTSLSSKENQNIVPLPQQSHHGTKYPQKIWIILF